MEPTIQPGGNPVNSSNKKNPKRLTIAQAKNGYVARSDNYYIDKEDEVYIAKDIDELLSIIKEYLS